MSRICIRLLLLCWYVHIRIVKLLLGKFSNFPSLHFSFFWLLKGINILVDNADEVSEKSADEVFAGDYLAVRAPA